MFDQPVSLRDLIRNPFVWLCAGLLGVVLFVFVPQLPDSLEIVLLAGLVVLLGVDANRGGRRRQEQGHAPVQQTWRLRALRPSIRPQRQVESADVVYGYPRMRVVDRAEHESHT